ncbi:MAG: bacteriorhodopsin [Alphaproteobacteria bacterium]|nr:bacteriorhodopsin [Alphaproteobacteria bacterium]
MSEMLQPNDIVGMSFWLMTLAMAGAAAFFLLERRRVERRWQAALTTLGVAMLVSALSYVNLAGVWAVTGNVPTVYRFADWQLTVPLLAVTFYLVLGAVTKVPVALFWRLLVASAVLTAAGYLGSAGFVSPTLGFLVALAGGLYILGEIYLGEAGRLNASSGNQKAQTAFNAMRLIATIGWAIYPLGYFMEYLGGGVDNEAINLIYNLADFLNKLAFGLIVWQVAANDREADGHRSPLSGA